MNILPNDDIFTLRAVEVIRITPDGRLFWKGREVETDEDFRSAMRELAERMVPSIPPVGTLVDQKLYNEACAEIERLTLLTKQLQRDCVKLRKMMVEDAATYGSRMPE